MSTKYIIIEDKVDYFEEIRNSIKNCDLSLELVISQPTTSYTYSKYLELIITHRPELIVLDQELKWRGYDDNENAEHILEALPKLYNGFSLPIIILTSSSFYNQMVSLYNNKKQQFTFFIQSTQNYLDKSKKEEIRKQLITVLDVTVRLKLILPDCPNIELIGEPYRFYEKVNGIPIYSYNICIDRLVFIIHNYGQTKAFMLFFNEIGQCVFLAIKISSNSFVEFYKYFPNLIDKSNFRYSGYFFERQRLKTEYLDVVQNTILISKLLDDKKIFEKLISFGVLPNS